MLFIDNSDLEIDTILNTLPSNETQLVEFVRTVEAIGQAHTTSVSLKFNASGPRGTQEKYLPVKISLSTDIPNFLEFLKKFEKIPYIVEIISINSEKAFESDTIWNLEINCNIYIRESFK